MATFIRYKYNELGTCMMFDDNHNQPQFLGTREFVCVWEGAKNKFGGEATAYVTIHAVK